MYQIIKQEACPAGLMCHKCMIRAFRGEKTLKHIVHTDVIIYH